MIRLVVDTNVLVAAGRSRLGASNMLLRSVSQRAVQMLASVPLFLEYEAVLLRPEQLLASGVPASTVMGFLDYLAGLVEPVRFHYLWRPQLPDIADEMVLETAINGRAEYVVTFNTSDFLPAVRFGIEVVTPAQMIGRMR